MWPENKMKWQVKLKLVSNIPPAVESQIEEMIQPPLWLKESRLLRSNVGDTYSFDMNLI